MEFEILRLNNGLRIIYQQDKSAQTVHCGFMIAAGSRDEHLHEHGLAHWIEHSIFKGTKRRKAFQILTRIDSVGGEINAFTTKEETCIYTSSLKVHFQRSAELLFDVVFNPSFPEKEIIKEKIVILDEINSYRDNPDEQLVDEYESLLFPNSSLGRTILGTPKSLKSFKRDDIITYIDRLYKLDRIVFTCVGNIPRSRLMKFVSNFLVPLKPTPQKPILRISPEAHVFSIHRSKSVFQTHVILGNQTIGLNDSRRKTMVLLNNIIGGPALNSILNLKVREKLGYCYYIESNYQPYSDIGLFQVYFGTDIQQFEKTLFVIQNQLDMLRNQKIADRKLDQYKKQLIGQIALSHENKSALMINLGKSLLHFDKVDSFAEMTAEIMDVNGNDILSLSDQVFNPSSMSLLAYMPKGKKRN